MSAKDRVDLVVEIVNYLRLDNVKQYHKSLYSENIKEFKYVGWNGFFNLKTGLPALFLKIRKDDDLLEVALEGLMWTPLISKIAEFIVISKKESKYETYHLIFEANPMMTKLIRYEGNGEITTIHKEPKLDNMFRFIKDNYFYE